MKRKLLRLLLVVSLLAYIPFSGGVAHASDFNPNNIIDDAVFNSVNTMNAAQIDAFLNTFASSCISPNSGFKAVDPTGYNPSQGYLYGGYVTAGQVIYDAAQVYGLNPRVLIVTLEKEQSLVTGRNNFAGYCNNGDQHKYAAAVGYGCPDSGTTYSYSGLSLYWRNGTVVSSTGTTCVNSAAKAGFSQQVIRAAWLFKFGQQRSMGNTGWAVIQGSWNNSDDPQTCYSGPMTQGTFARCPSGGAAYYDGYTTIDSTSVHIESGGTAALYWYTPHFHGNQNFSSLFTSWFGSPVGPGYGFVDAINPPSQVLPNEVVGTQIRIRNLSGKTWYNDGNVPAGQHPTRLAMLSYQSNPYANPSDPNWLGTSNQIKMQESSVADGGVATFTFTYKGPLQQVNSYFGQFVPVIDGVGFMPYIGLSFTTSTPQPVYAYSVTSSTGITANMPTSYSANVSYTIKNTGNVVWYNDTGSKPVGAASLRILTTNPYYHSSSFYDSSSWLAPNQIAMSDAKVAPGSSTTFAFKLKTPSTPGTYSESFGLVLDGAMAYPDTTQMNSTIVVSDYGYTIVSSNLPASLAPGQKYAAKIVLKNTGTATWYSDGNTPVNTHAIRLMTPGYASNRLADTSDPAWLNTSNQIALATTSVAPGENGEFNFTLLAPFSGLSTVNDFRFVLDGVYIAPGAIQKALTVPNLSASYNQQPGGVHPSLTPLAKGQVSNGKLIVRNTSNFVWYNDDVKPSQLRGGSVRVVMANPYYRSSPFANGSDPNWLGTSNQVKMTTQVVSPGENAEFNFSWKAPNQAGTYRERFTLVLDGYLLFPDIGMELVTVVQ